MATNNNTLGITVTSNVGGALPGINSVTGGLNGMAGAAAGATTAIGRLAPAFQQNRGLLQTFIGQARAGQLSLQGLSGAAANLGPALQRGARPANNAATALNNLGRIASDLPFGFIAIQNNLDPLVGSLGVLFSATGGLQGGFKALGQALLGPAGIALGFSVVSSLVTKAVQEYGSLGNAVNALNPFLSRAARLQAELGAASLKAGADALKESTHIDLLYKATQDLNVPLEERRKIADKLIEQYPQTFKGLTNEAFLAGEAASAYGRLKDQLLATAVVKAGDEVIAKRAKDLFNIRQEISETEARIRQMQSGPVTTFLGRSTGGTEAAIELQNALLIKQRKDLAAVEADIKVIQDEQLKVIQQYGAVAAGVVETKDKEAKKTKQVKTDTDRQADAIKQLRERVIELDAAFIAEGGTLDDLTDNKLKAFGKALGELANVGAGPGTALFENILRELQSLQNVANQPPVKVKIPIAIDPIPAATNTAAIEGIAKGVSADFSRAFVSANEKAINELLQKGAENGIAAISEGIGRALSGGGISAAFDGFVSALAGLGESLGKQLIAQGLAIEAFKNSLKSLSGVQAIAAGAALIAASAAFRNIAKGGVPSFATGGGIVGGPQLAMIGDNPGREEYVIPSEVLDSLGGGGMGTPEWRFTVDEMILWLDRGRRRING